MRVVRFACRPFEGASTYSTLGFSDSPVQLLGGDTCAQELLFAAWDSFPAPKVASFLLTFAEYVRSQRRALLRSEVIGPSTPLIPGVAANAVYASLPAIYPDGLACYRASKPPTILVWLVPLIGQECEIVRCNGWSNFEKLLENSNPDLLDLDRPSLV
ncbi:suppressor of fused domain protein [Pandoraea sputorum]